MQVTLAHRAEPSSDVLFQVIVGESVLLDIVSEEYFGLNAVGTRVWQLLSADQALSAAYAELCREYDTAQDELERDLITLVDNLPRAELVRDY